MALRRLITVENKTMSMFLIMLPAVTAVGSLKALTEMVFCLKMKLEMSVMCDYNVM